MSLIFYLLFNGLLLQSVPGQVNTLSYQETKLEITNLKSNLDTHELSYDSIGRLFTELLVEEIFPFWYGTPWTFEGHTSNPQEGTIACGYFVSTTLKHMGLNINRYHLAQQLPIHEAKTVALGKEVQVFEGDPEETENQWRALLDDGLYFIGFDAQHVGFLLKQGEQIEIIHSNFIESFGVVREPIEGSQVFYMFQRHYLVSLTNNQNLMRAWLKGSSIPVIKE